MNILTPHRTSFFMKLSSLASLALLVLLFAATPGAFAQGTGQVSGTVTDASGAAIPNVPVTIRNTGTNAERTSQSDSAGLYNINNLQPGQYEVVVNSPGFAEFKSSLEVTVGVHATIDPKLQVTSAATQVEVTADSAVQVNTQTQEVSQVVTQAQISQLPSLTRNPYDFVVLSGNVSSGDNTSAGNTQNGANRGVNFSLNGQRNSGSEILLDGVENLSVFGDQVGIKVPIDAVQEYRIITNNFSPEYGRASGGVVAVATKTGTNRFHGGLWEFNRLSAYTANTVTNAQTGVKKGHYTRNQFGGDLGGPILKDKLFFFGAAEFTRVRSSAALLAAVPDPALLAAAPANVQAFFTQYSGNNKFNVNSVTTNIQAGTPADSSGNPATPLYAQLPDSTPVFDIVSFTAPTDAGGGLPENTYNVVGRVDYNLSERTQAFFRYVLYNEIDQAGSAFATPYAQYNVGQATKGQAEILSLSHEFSSALSTVGKASFGRFNDQSNTYNTALQRTPTLIIAPNAQDPNSGQPFQLPGFYDLNPALGGLPFGGPQNTIQYNQDVNYTFGKHAVQVGGQILYIQDNSAYGALAQANEQLGSNQKKGLQNFLTGNLYEFQAAVNPQGALPCVRNPYTGALDTSNPNCLIKLPATQPAFARSERFHDWAAYAQDQWKATARLTVDYGVRYEYFGVQHNNKSALDSNFVYGPGATLPERIRSGTIDTVPNSPVHGLWHPQYGTVSPRIGFAFDLFGNGRTSLRGGYGISYERNFGNVTFNLIQNPPNYAVVVVTGTSLNPVPVTNSNAGPLAGASGVVALPPTSVRQVDQNIRTAQTQFHSFTIDQQLGRGSVLELTYNGARGIHLYDIKNYNGAGSGNALLGDPVTDPVTGNAALTRLNPQFSNMNNRGSNGDSYYNSFNAQFQTQDIRHTGLSLVANYTFAHALDDLSTTFSETSATNFALGYTDPFNPAIDHGNSDFDIRHRLVLAPIYRTPFFMKSKGSYLAQLLGGYQVAGIYTVRTGTPFTYYDSTNDFSGYNVPRYNPISPVRNHTFKSIPSGATNTGNKYQLTSGGGQTTGAALPADNPFANDVLFDAYNPGVGISDWGPYPSTMTGRNTFRGPGAYNLDLAISKTFPIHEQVNLEFRAEGFNITNHHNLYIQQSQLDAANNNASPQIFASKGGVAGGANDERRFGQFALKLNF